MEVMITVVCVLPNNKLIRRPEHVELQKVMKNLCKVSIKLLC